MKTVAELLEGHVTLTVESLDRLYLNGYVPTLQTGCQLVRFLESRRGGKYCSPALLQQSGDRFKASVERFAADLGLEIHHFAKRERKDTTAAEARTGLTEAERVYLVGVAQEKCNAFKGKRRREKSGRVFFEFGRQPVWVNHYYFYLFDDDFGPAFIKVGTYAPYPVRVCVNGHEWLKRQLTKEGVPFVPLDNGVLSCADPDRLRQLANRLGPEQIAAFFDKWAARLPMPLDAADREAGYSWRLSVWQAEVSLTQVFDLRLRGRQFFEEVIRENLDLGRPDRVQLLFDRRIVKATPGPFATRVIHAGVTPILHIAYKSCDIKQYFKECLALRTETTINNTSDFGIGKDLSNLWQLRKIGTDINRRLLGIEKVTQACLLEPESVDHIIHPTVDPDGQRAPALRFGDPRTMALMAALFLMSHLPVGFSNRSLRGSVADLLGPARHYGARQMTYDLRRLRLKGLVERIPHTNRYRLTSTGLRAAALFTKINQRIICPAAEAMLPDGPIPRPLRDAYNRLDRELNAIYGQASLVA